MHLSDYIAAAIERLKKAGVDNPALDARLLAGHALACDRAQLLSQSGRDLNEAEMEALEALLARRMARESVARIIGRREFWGLDVGLNEATLEPRPDSETLVEAVRRIWPAESSETPASPHILDLGTGSGCLLLALLHEMPRATGVGIDIDPRAVEQAAANAGALGLGGRAAFRTGDWLKGVAETFDIIVSNPPYIPARDIPALMPEVKNHDPMQALNGGEDGLDPYRLLIPQLQGCLNPKGLAAFEVGIGQSGQVAALFQENNFTHIAKHKDLGGIERCVTALKPAF